MKVKGFHLQRRGAVAQSVERATPSDKVLGLIPAVAARIWLGLYLYNLTG